MITAALGASLTAAATTAVATPLVARVAISVGLLDRPGPLKVQTRPVPYLGGVAVALGLLASSGFGDAQLLAPLAVALVLGLIDDARGLSVGVRLVAEIGVGVSVAVTADGRAGAASAAAAIVLTVLLVNAVNMVDGMDGLAAGVVGASAVGCSLLSSGRWAVLAAALAGGCAGFLVHNRPPARIYLGDAGSYLLGSAAAVLVVHILSGPISRRGGAATVGAVIGGGILLVAYPAVELTVTVLRRVLRGESPFAGDRNHLYDQLRRRETSVWHTLIGLSGAQCVAVVAGVLVLHGRG